ncbi:hypothetical protein [Streptomyces sp. NBC_01408]|uniref:hypothetical protein n=1 Tax=Streptomyces sp. NBC_01408 TaxID=2903855 RepID=UPI0022501CFA|nr:hypothetical protein [Streptomyces sp. NBC_01408]MCX4695671.1 hypothetical protein [Streptomyces sp. NBC_01408]
MGGPSAQPDPPVIRQVRYDSSVLTVSWSGPGRPNPVPTYVVYVLNGDRTVAEAWAGAATNASLPLDVAPGQTYRAQIGMYTSNSDPKYSPETPIVTDTSTVERAETDPVSGALTLSWKAADTDDFLVRLVVNGTAPDPEAPVAGGSFVVKQPPPPGSTVAATLARVRTGEDVVSIGPHGPGFAAPTERPELLAVEFDAGLLSVAWAAVPTADAYWISVLNDHGVFFVAAEVHAPATTAELEPGIADDGAYSVVVQAVNKAGSGPPSPPLRIRLTLPGVTSVTSDGTTVSIDVEPPDFAPTAYDAVLFRDGVPVRRETLSPAPTLSLAVPGPLPRGAAYAVSVRGRAGRSAGPAVTAPVVPAAPAVASVVCDEELVVAATAGELPQGVPIEAVLYVDGVPDTPQQVGPDGTAEFPVPDGDAAVAVAVRGVDGVATGPWSVPLPAPTEPTDLTLARVDGGRVALAWGGPPDGTFRAAVGDTALLVQGQAADLPLTSGLATVAQVAGVARGPVTSLDLVTAGPRLTGVAVGAARSVALEWTPPESPPLTGVQPVVRWAGAEVELDVQPVTGDPIVLTLPDGIPNTATIALRGLAGTAVGPPGNAAALLTVAPTAVRVAYDGADLRVSWDALPSPLVNGYRVSTVVDETVTTLGDTRATSGSWPVKIEDTSTVVVVQALAGPAVGAPSEPVPVFTEALFVGRSYVAPQLGPVLTATDITLGLPELFVTPQAEVVDLPLGLVLTPADSGPYAYTLLIPATSPVWNFTDRPDVIAKWGALLSQLQPLGVTPYGVGALTEAMSRSMPQTFAETLYFAYGLRFDRGCFDVRPGIVMRVEYEGYQIAPGAQGNPLSGFVTAGVADYEVASYDNSGTWTNGLDAFLDELAQQNGVDVPNPSGPPNQQGQLYGSGGAFDLFAKALRLPYARLVYPKTLLPTTTPGSLWPQQNAVLLAATSLAALDAATENVRRQDPPGGGVAAAYLRGRAVVRAMVRISVNGAPRLVPVGTTLGNVLASVGRRPSAVPVPLSGVTMHRPRTAAAPADGTAGDWLVVPGWEPRDPAALTLPLLHGDRLDLATGLG